MSLYDSIKKEFSEELLDRFLRYVAIDTTSNMAISQERIPSTEGQWNLLRLLESEFLEMGFNNVNLDAFGYLIARIPGNPGENHGKTIGFMAHVDTSSDMPGANIRPLVHRNYNGEAINLADGIVLSTANSPLLKRYENETIITSDGRTLLGADDKAGIAEIMTALSWIRKNNSWPHRPLEIIFTPDEETGNGMSRFPHEELESDHCFAVDGGEEGEVEIECFYAWLAKICFNGHSIHPGSGRGRLVNAISMAAMFISMLPRNESPEATDGRYGNYWAHEVQGGIDSTELTVFYRSFDLEDIERRSRALESFARAVEAAFPGGRVTIKLKEIYRNVREILDGYPNLIARLREAVLDSGIQPIESSIRGGSDGALLTAMGIPTLNTFAGGINFHSRLEWIALPAMVRATTVILNLMQ